MRARTVSFPTFSGLCAAKNRRSRAMWSASEPGSTSAAGAAGAEDAAVEAAPAYALVDVVPRFMNRPPDDDALAALAARSSRSRAAAASASAAASSSASATQANATVVGVSAQLVGVEACLGDVLRIRSASSLARSMSWRARLSASLARRSAASAANRSSSARRAAWKGAVMVSYGCAFVVSAAAVDMLAQQIPHLCSLRLSLFPSDFRALGFLFCQTLGFTGTTPIEPGKGERAAPNRHGVLDWAGSPFFLASSMALDTRLQRLSAFAVRHRVDDERHEELVVVLAYHLLHLCVQHRAVGQRRGHVSFSCAWLLTIVKY